jgi:glycosyltransferase involved in cell wall biosynthesis
MRPLRFAMVTTFYPPFNFGGDGIAVQRLSRALVQRGHEVTVIHDVDAYRLLAPHGLPADGTEPGKLEVVRLRSRLGPLAPLLTHQAGRPIVHGRQIRSKLTEGRFDVVQFHNISLVGGPGVLSAGNSLKIYEAHEHWLVCPTHVLWRHGREPCSGRQCIRCVLRHRRPLQYWRYTGYLQQQLEHLDVIIAKSEFSRRKHREFGLAREMDVLPYFLPSADSTPASTPEREQASPHPRPYFLFVGRLERIKGLDGVIEVFARHREADLLVAGDGEHGDVLRELAAGADNVRFLGRMRPADLSDYYRGAIALIVPSLCFETFGIVLLEAFRHGTPVIARRIGPFPEIIEESGGGLLFEGDDQLVEAMSRLSCETGLRQRMGQAALVSFEQRWSEKAVIPRYLEIVRSAAERRGMQEVADTLAMESAA